MPLARNVVKDLAAEHGACQRPVQLRRTEIDTGYVEQVLIPCGHTLASVCPPCAERARILRATQCREGWHLDHEPVIDPDPATGEQRALVTDRAEAQADRDALANEGLDTADLDERIGELDEQITDAGMRGNVLPNQSRRHRSTRRQAGRRTTATPPGQQPDGRQDLHRAGREDLPTVPVRDADLPVLWPGLRGRSTRRPGHLRLHAGPPGTRCTSRRCSTGSSRTCAALVGYDLQYFAAIEPQRRLAPHVHIAIRGTISRAELREVIAATYHQVWWPSTAAVKYDGGHLPVWDEHTGTYLDPGTGEVLPTWDQALDAIGDEDEPLHVARFGDRFDAQGVLAGSKDASRCIGYLTKYLTKHVGDCHQATTDAQAAHAGRLADALRYEPCSPTCANWLRYGIQPKNARPGLRPGCCKGKAHRREYLGYAGRRVLVSRKWSGKTLADHRADRKAWLTGMLGLPATDPSRYSWEPVKPGDPDHMPNGQRLLHVVADRIQWQTALEQARRRAAEADLPATGRAA